MTWAFYNENDPYPAAWLRALIAAGLVMRGTVDERSVAELRPADLAGARRAHFFAGIAGWDLALRLAGWPDGREVWTGSCPCQPFSGAGRRRGFADDRHLWPVWFRLIDACRPAVVLGEQVASPDGLRWLDAVCADLEAAGYACRAADLCAAGVGAPHIRQRLWWVGQRLDYSPGPRCQSSGEGAESEARDQARLRRPECGCAGGGVADTGLSRGQRRPDKQRSSGAIQGKRDEEAADDQRSSTACGLADSGRFGPKEPEQPAAGREQCGTACRMVNTQGQRRHREQDPSEQAGRPGPEGPGGTGRVADSNGLDDDRAGYGSGCNSGQWDEKEGVSGIKNVCRMGHAHNAGLQERGCGPDQQPDPEGRQDAERPAGLPGNPWSDSFPLQLRKCESHTESADSMSGLREISIRHRYPWSDSIWLPCADGKARRVKPGIEPLAHGIPNRVGALRGAGNAIVPQVAARFIRAFMDIETNKGGS